MSLRRFVPRVLVCALGILSFSSARADKFTFAGNFSADNSMYELSVSTLVKQTFTFTTHQIPTGGFVPVLTLFDASGNYIGSDDSGSRNANLSESLQAGQYELFLTEFPNTQNGNPGEGFLFPNDPTETGDLCSVSGGMFLDTSTTKCTQRNGSFDLTVDSGKAAVVMPVASTPEPSSLLLMLAPAAGLVWNRRRQNASI